MKNEAAHAAFTRRTRGTLFGNETVAASSIVPTLRKPRRTGQPAPLACEAVGVAIRRQLLGDECGASDRFSLRSVVLTHSQRARKRAQGLWKGTALAVPLECRRIGALVCA